MKNLHIKRMETFKCSLKVICLFTPKIPHKEEFEYLKKTKHQHSDGNAHNAIVRYVMKKRTLYCICLFNIQFFFC